MWRLALFFFSTGLIGLNLFASENSALQVAKVSGKAYWVSANQTSKARLYLGQVLPEGAYLVTLAGSELTLRMGEGFELRVPEETVLIAAYSEQRERFLFQVKRGEVLYRSHEPEVPAQVKTKVDGWVQLQGAGRFNRKAVYAMSPVEKREFFEQIDEKERENLGLTILP